MNYKISAAGRFQKEIRKLVKKYPSLKSEYALLIAALKEDPFIGTPIGHDCYKIRIAIASKNRGKSGGARVITHVYVADATIYLLSIYDKSEQDNISDNDLLNLIHTLK